METERALNKSGVRRKHFPQGEEGVERLSSSVGSTHKNLKVRGAHNGENLKFKMETARD